MRINQDFPIDRVIKAVKRMVSRWENPIVTKLAEKKRDPFRVLIATMLSLRTKDACTAEAAGRLFQLADTPPKTLNLDEKTIAKAIYPVGFYNTKARNILQVCRELIERFEGRTPDTIDELVTLPGVGRKTANLVLSQGYQIPAICVDTHVHRITNRWGYIETRNPLETEMTLRQILPKKHWIPINSLLVSFGQKTCAPISPWCSKCKVKKDCAQVALNRSR